jgi:macrolide transport system ATP-binding/permease protein
MWNSIWQDIRYAARLVRNNPGFSAVIIVCLALGIGPTTTTFSLINASLLHPVDVESPEMLVTILTNRVGAERPSEGISYPNFVDLRDRSTTLDVAVAVGATLSIRSEGTSELARGAMVSPNFFDVLGRKALLGEVFHASDNDTPGSQPVVVLGYAYWQEKFHGRTDVVGTTMRLNGHDFKVLGVMPQSFTGQMAVTQPILWVSTTMLDEIRPDIPSQRFQRNHSWMEPFARIRPGANIKQSNKDLADISRQLATEFPQSNEFMSFTAAPFTGIPVSIAEGVGQLVALAGVVVLLLLLLSCSSTAALQLARATVRRREIAIRMAIGASRWRIVRQLLVESVFVAILAGGLALLLTLWVFELYKVLLPEGSGGIVLGSSLDYRVLGFTLLASVLAGILFGLAPAWQMSRPDLIAPLKSQDPGGDFGSARVRNVLVAAQFALAVVLLISAGLFVKGLRRAQTLDPGFETERMVIFDTDLTIYGYSMQRSKQFVDDFLKRVGELPGVESVSVSRFPPLSRSSSMTGMTPIGKDLTAGTPIMVGLNWAAPDYFDTVGIPFVAGRDFAETDSRSSQRVVIINESLARRFGGAKEAVGKMATSGPGESAEIVGVVKDSKYWSFGEEDVDFAYLAVEQMPTRELAFCIRTHGDAAAMLTPIASEIRSFNNDLALSPLRTIQDHTRQSLAPARMSAILFAVMGGLALVLAVIGVYGVVSYSVTRRQLEIGVRMALGGQPRDLIGLLVRRGLRLVAIGAAVGICAAFGVTRFLAPLLSGASPTDWQVFVVVPLVLLAVAWLAIYLPARKATRVDPMVVLRYE